MIAGSTKPNIAAPIESQKLVDKIEPKKFDWKNLVLFTVVFSLACLTYFSWLDKFPLFNPDEALYAEPAREMNELGEYVTTYLNYQVRYTKPPLCIWAMALAYKAFGATEWAARMFSAACGSILVGATYLLVQKYASKKTALLAAMFLLTAPLYLASSKLAITDIPLALFVTGSLFSFFHSYEQKLKSYKWLAWCLLGFGVMTKGPVAVILVVAVLFFYHLINRDLWPALKYYNPITGALVVGAIALPWFCYEIYITKGEYYYAFLVRENLQRFTSVVDHKYPWWYHFAAMYGGFMPWSLLLPAAYFKFARPSKPISPEAKLGLFAAVTSLVILLFFSSSVSKLLPYTLPAFPANAILAALGVSYLLNKKILWPVQVMFAGLCITAVAAVFLAPYIVDRIRDCPIALAYEIVGAAFLIGTVSFISLVASRVTKTLTPSLLALSGLMVGCVVFAGPNAISIFNKDWEETPLSFVQYAANTSEPIVIYQVRKPSAPFYAKRKVEVIPDLPAMQKAAPTLKSAYLIARTDKEPELKSVLGNRFKIRVKQGRFMLAQIEKTPGL
ncbi:MAG: glycosyltransferase family 39 protein [Candidatus Melainabacteria bacterium]|nr:MAG: glycosyltransferase family 39 protein [Candidatus Melainabacteria bacterium]